MNKFIHVFLICLISAIFYTGCKSFDPVIIPGEPSECNDYYTLLDFYSRMCKKPLFGSAACNPDSAFLGVQYEKCSQARKDKNIAEIKRLNEKVTTLCEQLHPENLDDFKRCMK